MGTSSNSSLMIWPAPALVLSWSRQSRISFPRFSTARRGSGSAALSSFPRLGFEAEIGANVRVGRVFERRFRDIHTLAQQIQSRDAHYETVGQVLLGNPPEVFL